jgi:hypothetical protein
MDPLERHSLRSRTALMSDARLLQAVIMSVVLLLTLAGFLGGELQTAREHWPWRNAIQTEAVVVRHDVVPEAAPEGKQSALIQNQKYQHLIEYSYTAGDEQLFWTIDRSSGSKDSISLGWHPRTGVQRYPFEPDSRIPAYYQPQAPHEHVLFVDPRPPYWESSRILGIAGGLALVGLVIVVLLVLFYRPQDVRRRMPEKLELPELET